MVPIPGVIEIPAPDVSVPIIGAEPDVTPIINSPLSISGKSSRVNVRNVGSPAAPVGAAKKVLALWGARVTSNVPLVVMGDPITLNIEGTVSATLVT
jgi:hypothetical protein